jgi:hypothetical protein
MRVEKPVGNKHFVDNAGKNLLKNKLNFAFESSRVQGYAYISDSCTHLNKLVSSLWYPKLQGFG